MTTPRAHRLLRPFARVEAGEAGTVLLLMLTLFLLLSSYYILKTVREPLILVGGGAEVKSYTAAAQALLLLAIVPWYSRLVNRVGRARLVNRVGLFFTLNILVFAALAPVGVPYLGVVFFVWVGIFSLMVIAQLWSFANDLYTPEQGKRLFALIAAGSSLGAIVGAWLAGVLLKLGLGVAAMMLAAAALLLLSVGLTALVQRRERARLDELGALRPLAPQADRGLRSGFALVLRDRYLLAIAALILVLNVVNTTGEFILGRAVREAALAALPLGSEAELNAFVGGFYADFFTVVNIAGALLQLFAVSRLLAVLGIRGALLVLPVIALGGYTLLAVAPALVLIRVVKTLENATDYSLQNTLRHALFLPTSAEAKYKAKQAIDTFCVRLGDVASAGVVFIGATAGLSTAGFAIVNAALVLVWLGLAVVIGRRYKRLAATVAVVWMLLAGPGAAPAHAAQPGAGSAPVDTLTAPHPGPVPLTTLRGTDTLPDRGGNALQRVGHWLLVPPYLALSAVTLPLEELAALNEKHSLSTLLARLFVWRVDPVDTDITVTFGYDSQLGPSAIGLRTTADDWLGTGGDLRAEAAYLAPAENFLLLAWTRAAGAFALRASGSLEHDWKAPFFGLGPDAPRERARADRRLAVADVQAAWPARSTQQVMVGAYGRAQALFAPSSGRSVARQYPGPWEQARRARYAGAYAAWRLDTRPDGEFSRHGARLGLEGGLNQAHEGNDADYRHLALEAQAHVDLRRGRTLVVRGWAETVDADAPEHVPYTELPALGGRRTVRGYETSRFTDTTALVLGAEYRWPVLSTVQAQLFCDWGTVSPDLATLRLAATEPSVGLALVGRLRGDHSVVLQVARSPETWRVYVGSGLSFTMPERRWR